MAGGKRKAEEELDRGDGYKNGVQDAGVPSIGPKAPDGKRKADCLASVTALNTQFASWIQKQQQDRPFDLWRMGVQDYLRHAEKILSDFHDVVDWISSTSGQNGSTAEQPEVSKAPEAKTPPADASAFKGWGKFEKENGGKSAANGAPQEQGKAFAWAPVAKTGELSSSQKPGDWKGAFPGLAFGKKDEGVGGVQSSKKDKGGSALPGWGSGFDVGAKGEKETEGGEAGTKEGGKRSAFKFPTLGAGFASEGPKTAPTFTAPLFDQPASTSETSTKVAPTPLFTVPPFQPSSLSAPPTTGGKSAFGETSKTGPQVAPVFSVPQFPSLVQAAPVPAIKTSVTPGAFDWAAGFKNPAPVSGAAPSFSLPGAKALAGGAQEGAGKKGAGEEERKGEEEAGEGEAPNEPSSPSFKAADEEGVENVLDTPIRVYRMGQGPNAQWEDQGTGSLMLKRDKGAALKSKEANARIVFRNPGGKVLLNARLYVGMKLELAKGAVNTILTTTETSTASKGEDEGKPAEPVMEVVTRLYAFKRQKQGGMASEELKAALERQVPSEDTPNAKS